ncbi:hypothetical protein [Bradyrhizobium sp.]|uniref:hypothetical protein n=1 Tax=Bradyrhizobium sp. TaxID=376 RepID=UPI00260BB336|nr:hypothetical protein [Bradyrhizobium sp.]
MSRLIMGITSVVALSLVSGAAEFARGRDLPLIAGNLAAGRHAPITQGISISSNVSREGASRVNRASKADRAATQVGVVASTRTVSLQLNGFADTSFLVRIPVAIASPPAAAAPTEPAAIRSKLAVACEPVVSILTDVAKRLGPGRCIT